MLHEYIYIQAMYILNLEEFANFMHYITLRGKNLSVKAKIKPPKLFSSFAVLAKLTLALSGTAFGTKGQDLMHLVSYQKLINVNEKAWCVKIFLGEILPF